MSAPPVFKAAFCDVKPIKTRQMVQFIFEVPVTEADEAMKALGGFPNPAVEVWAGIARINPSKITDKPASEAPTQDNEPSPGMRRRFRELPYAQQAAMRCQEPAFLKFVEERGSEDAVKYVRDTCGVASRAEIVKGTEAGKRWEWIEGAYVAWKAVA